MSGNIIELLYNSLETSASDTVQFNKFVHSCLEHGSFYGQDKIEGVIKIINNCLNSSFDKEKGLILLQNLLTHISVETFSSNAVSWMVNCSKIISQKEGINSVLALQVLSKLIKLSVKFPEVNKEAAKQIVPKFLLDHVRRKTVPQVSVELLECVQSCMSAYPGPSGEFRLDIVKLLLSTTETRREVVEAASRCVPLVAGVGGGGKQGVSHKTAWQRQQVALVRLLHTLLNRLYEHVDCLVEEKTAAAEDVQLSLELIDDRNIVTKSQRLATQFSTVALFLQAMLLEEFPVAKAVAPDAILDVIAHAQKPTLATLGSSREALAVTAVLPTVQVAALRLLESLVLCLGRNLVPHAGLVCYLCSQVVHWTYQQHSDWPYAMDKPFSRTRLAAYCCLQSWLSVAASASQLDTVVDKLLPPMLADIRAEKPSVRLRVGKGRKRQQVLVSEEDRSERLGDPAANSELCERALLSLGALLRATSARLKPDIVSSITNTVLRLVADLPVPYSNANCLTALYQLLLTLCLEPHPRLAPPLPQALAVFTAGIHHSHPLVRATCVAALSSLDKIIHPTAAALYFPLIQDKQQCGNYIQDEENGDDKHFTPVTKRMKINSQNYTWPGMEEGEEKSSLKPSNEKHIEVIDCDDSSESEEIVELVPIENPVENVDSEEVENPVENVDSEEVEKIVKMDEESNEELGDSQSTEEGKSSLNSEGSKIVSYEEDEGNKARFHCTGESDKPHSPSVSKTEGDQSENEKCLLEADKEEDDADVSQMLMDFTDEVNDGSGN